MIIFSRLLLNESVSQSQPVTQADGLTDCCTRQSFSREQRQTFPDSEVVLLLRESLLRFIPPTPRRMKAARLWLSIETKDLRLASETRLPQSGASRSPAECVTAGKVLHFFRETDSAARPGRYRR